MNQPSETPAPAQPMTDKPTGQPGAGSDPAAPAHDDWLLDESLRETFPASDPIAPAAERRRGGDPAPR